MWCGVLQFHFYLSFFHALHFMSIFICIFYIVYDLGTLGIAWKIKFMGFFYKSMTCSQLIRAFRQLIRGYSVPPPNWRDEFPMVSTLVYVVTHWTRPTVSHDWRLSSSHVMISPNCFIMLFFNLERILNLC